jgi:diguanylate cyclase (GGDEF)-like protein
MPGKEDLVRDRVVYDAVRTTQTYAVVLGLAGLMMIASFALPSAPARNTDALLVVAALTILIAALLDLTRDRLPRNAPLALPTLGTALVAAAGYYAGDVAVGAYAMLFFWVALPGAYLLPPTFALPQVAIAAAACAATLLLAESLRLSGLYAALGAGSLCLVAVVLVALRSGERRRLAWLERSAATDPLTGLANRPAFEQRTEQELQRALRTGRPFTVIVVDLDHFKAVNDRFGHAAGDSVLSRAGEELARNARAADTVARLGGDEFAILLPETAAADAEEVAHRMQGSIRSAFSGAPQPLTGSFGVATFPDHAGTAAELLGSADQAMYAAKASGRDRIRLYAPVRVISVREAPPGDEPGGPNPRLGALLSVAEEVERRKSGANIAWRAALVADGLARTMGLDRFRCDLVQLAARLRDVGQAGFPDELLRRPGALDDGHWSRIHRHPQIGARMLASAQLDGELREWVLCHHERLDGGGYPRGLRGEQIPIEARIVAVADAYTALQAPRPWRPPLTPDEAREVLLREAGTHFDPEVVEALVSLSSEHE